MSSPFAENLVERIAAIQREIDAAEWAPTGDAVVGATKNDSVRVHFRDNGTTTMVEIDPTIVDPLRVRQLEQLVATAVQDASDRLRQLRAQRITAAIRAMVDDLLSPAVSKEH